VPNDSPYSGAWPDPPGPPPTAPFPLVGQDPAEYEALKAKYDKQRAQWEAEYLAIFGHAYDPTPKHPEGPAAYLWIDPESGKVVALPAVDVPIIFGTQASGIAGDPFVQPDGSSSYAAATTTLPDGTPIPHLDESEWYAGTYLDGVTWIMDRQTRRWLWAFVQYDGETYTYDIRTASWDKPPPAAAVPWMLPAPGQEPPLWIAWESGAFNAVRQGEQEQRTQRDWMTFAVVAAVGVWFLWKW
jgi:hypothetical protein